MEHLISDYLALLCDSFLNAQKRVFWGYLAAALFLALIFQSLYAKSPIRHSFSYIFSLDIWFSASARADYKMLLINQAIMMGIVPKLVTQLAVATVLFEAMHLWFNGRILLWTEAPGWFIAAFFTVSLFLMDDVTKYFVHRALHRWPLLWHFHRVHHSAETLTPLTVYRTHPIEGVIFALRSVFVQAVMVTVFIYFFGDRATLATLLGANAMLFVFNVTGSNLRHSHVRISYGRFLEHIFISPAQHQIHHSRHSRHHDMNFGAVLAVWDWIGGSLYCEQKEETYIFGVGDGKAPRHDLKSLYWNPCVDATGSIFSAFRKGIFKMKTVLVIKLRAVNRAACLFTMLAIAAAAMPGHAQDKAGELNIYSHRQPFLINPFIDAYKEKTGTKVNIVFASKGLAQRLQAEGKRSPADLILTVDIARLNVYADKNLLAPVQSQILTDNIPPHLRDPGNKWFALSKRARIIVAAKRAKDGNLIKNYEDLSNPKWKDRVCARPGSHVYNRALIASMIHSLGVRAAEDWARGVVSNLARRPQGNDRAQVKAIYEGVCDFAVINNYYYGKLRYSKNPDQKKWAESVYLIFPNQDDRGTHVNISGGGVARFSKNKAEAVRFLEFLTSEMAQKLYGSVNFEYPVNPNVAPTKELVSWGMFKEDKMPISRISELASDAQKIIDRVGW